MPRYTSAGWWCYSCQQKNSPDSHKCSKCKAPRHERHAQVHTSERAVVYFNPATGEHRTPARNDQPLPDVYAQQGFERREIMHMGSYERETGVVHEATSFNPGNEPATGDPVMPKPDPQTVHDLAVDISKAVASGPWTGQERFS